jgi:hypothetical protein
MSKYLYFQANNAVIMMMTRTRARHPFDNGEGAVNRDLFGHLLSLPLGPSYPSILFEKGGEDLFPSISSPHLDFLLVNPRCAAYPRLASRSQRQEAQRDNHRKLSGARAPDSMVLPTT